MGTFVPTGGMGLSPNNRLGSLQGMDSAQQLGCTISQLIRNERILRLESLFFRARGVTSIRGRGEQKSLSKRE